ncbi:hypothetical protein NQ176_g8109 [Zarea fungicola]|uniref:Uncharacterized protein n=1 Tax=Zarea fungicola TaxID=93591 RepID=A0ACC1MWN6_9HYPO|nr:hypothetical protein NQ176_g8109 [Lecanicillium fungicola]
MRRVVAVPSQLLAQRSLARACARRTFGATQCFSSSILHRQDEKQWSTPLAKQLFEAISTTGTVPLASFMRMCLTGDVGGYYTGAIGEGRDQFGVKGDFVTSPEISQIFGELIGVWFIAEWMSQGRPKEGVQLIEVGPGRGTLMDDVLRTISRFPALANSVEAVYMVEASPELRSAQKDLLCGQGAPSTESKAGYHSTGKYDGLPIVWTQTIKSVPQEASKTPFIIAHEFFDALPIHSFQTAKAVAKPAPNTPSASGSEADDAPTKMEWREMMVSPTAPGTRSTELSSSNYRFNPDDPPAEFQLTLSPGTTRHSRYLPESSPRYRKLKNMEGAIVEVCPDAALYAADFAARIGGTDKNPKSSPSGAALILDYGPSDSIPINSLRGIRHHKIVNPFSSPGLVDLSADVDFTAIAAAATLSSDGVEVHGPISQADFLELMGIRERAAALAKGAGSNKEAAEAIDKAYKRLVCRGPSGMGKVYKALAILPENGGKRRPVGFGGDVSS